MLEEDLITRYSESFYGFGTWKADIWFIGMEEGGGATIKEVQDRLIAWDKNGCLELENAPEFYPISGCTKWHSPSAKLQFTWKQLLRMFFLGQGKEASDDILLKFQRERLGHQQERICLTELLPLPSPNTKTWNYPMWSEIEWLRTRKAYEARWALPRSCMLKLRIKANKPKIVIFYGTTQLRYWSQICGGLFSQAIDRKLMTYRDNTTTYFVTRHPSREDDEYFTDIGKYLFKNHSNHFIGE